MTPTPTPTPSEPASEGTDQTPEAQGPSEAKWQEALDGARQEGKLVLVTHTTLYYRGVVEAFQEAFPDIEVEHVTIQPSEYAATCYHGAGERGLRGGCLDVLHQQHAQLRVACWRVPRDAAVPDPR